MARRFLRSYCSLLRSYSCNFQKAKAASSNPPNLAEPYATSNPPNLAEEDKPYEKLDSEQIFKAKRSEYWDMFESWMSEHNKSYSCEKEMVYRFFNFTETLDLIHQLRRVNPRTRAHLTEHSDLSQQEVFEIGVAFLESKRSTDSENSGDCEDSEKSGDSEK